MNETAKTLTFVAVAAAAVGLAVLPNISFRSAAEDDVRNQLLYDGLKPLDVAAMQIFEYDEAAASVHEFEVAEKPVKGVTRWVIPSHFDYPADAKDQVALAASSLMGLRIIEMVSDRPGDRAEYGVVDPDPKTLKVGDTGVGMKVVMKNAAGKELLALVIGKEASTGGKESFERPSLRYVRKVEEGAIYKVDIKTDKLSTKFENWIERNLLSINTFDMKQIRIHDYAIRVTARGTGAIFENGKMRIEANDSGEPKWKLADDEKFVADADGANGRWEPVKMAGDEELNTETLDKLKFALDDLKIVDISAKPKGLSADLTVSADFGKSEEARDDLQEKGFYAVPMKRNGPVEIFSNEGEVRLAMKDGVEYVLRFGDIAGPASGPSKKDEKPKGKKDEADKDKEKKGDGVNRYLFVMAEFNPDMIPKPQFDPLPEDKPADAKADEKKAEEKKDEAADKKTDDKKAGEKKAEETPRQKVEKENKRKQDEYDQKIADGKKHTADLNARFADWYYVIADDVYRKIHLSRADIVKKKEPPKEKAGEKGGEKPEDKPAAMPGDKAEEKPGAKVEEKPADKAETPAEKPADKPEAKPAETKDEHAGHDHGEMPKPPAGPEKPKDEGAKGEK
jgi:hypothetical protein